MQEQNQSMQRQPRTRGAVGKALLVYWGTGSIVLAIIAYLAFNAMGC